jgi:hypothetical protein
MIAPCGDAIQKLFQTCTDGERMLVDDQSGPTTAEAPSNETADLATAELIQTEDARTPILLTRSELAGLSPVARQILSELLSGLAKASDSVNI